MDRQLPAALPETLSRHMEMVENSAQPNLHYSVMLSTLLALLAIQLIGAITLHPTLFPSLAASGFSDAMSFLMSVSGSIIILQTAVIVQSRWPTRPAWYFVGAMIVVGAVFSELPLITHYFGLTDTNVPKLVAILIVTTSIQIGTCIILLKCLSCWCCFWLVDPSCDQTDLIERMTPTQWSIRGFMVLTLVVAVTITAGQSLNWGGFVGWLPQMLGLGMYSVSAAYLAAYFSSGGRRLMVAYVGIITLILLGVFPNGIWLPLVYHPPLAVLTVLLHLWMFHRWKRAGFGLIGWMRGKGFSPGSMARDQSVTSLCG